MTTMFKALKAQMGVFGLARTPLRLHTLSQGEPVNIQHVQMRQKWWRPKRLVVNTVGFVMTLYVFDTLILNTLDRAADKIESRLSEKEKKELEEMDDEPLFIPFPLTIQQKLPVPYKGSDPEWLEFIKFSKDPELGKRIRDQLANMMKETCEKHPLIIMRAGKEMKVRKVWLDVDFPVTAPPEFEQSGIEIGDDGVSWTQHPIDCDTVSRLKKVLWPTGPAKAFWAFHKALAISFLNTGAVALGFAPLAQPSLEAMMAQHAAMVKQMTKSKEGASDKSNEIPKNSMGIPTTRNIGAEPPKLPEPVQKKSRAEWNAMSPEEKHDHLRKNLAATQAALATHFAGPVQSAKITLLQNLKKTQMQIPRGSILVSGLVELDCPKAWIVVDVKAAWDPKTREYDKKSMTMGLRRIQMKKQPPARG